jgi:hypothetical protein
MAPGRILPENSRANLENRILSAISRATISGRFSGRQRLQRTVPYQRAVFQQQAENSELA